MYLRLGNYLPNVTDNTLYVQNNTLIWQGGIDSANQIQIGAFDTLLSPNSGMLQWTGTALELYNGTIWKNILETSITPGSITGAILHWDGTNWIENGNLIINTNGGIELTQEIRIGPVSSIPQSGMIQYTGTAFYGYDGTIWNQLDKVYKIHYQNNINCNITNVDNDLACNITVEKNPVDGSGINIYVNGIRVELGDGVGTTVCYFTQSGDGNPANARGFSNSHINGKISINDQLYWNGSIAGFELSTTDIMTFEYLV